MAGTIYDYNLKNGKRAYRVVYRVKTPNGKTQQKQKRGFSTKKEAQTFLTEVQYSLNNRTYIAESKTTLQDYMPQWLFEYMAPRLKQITVDGHWKKIKNHILPRLGTIRIQDLTPHDLEMFYNDLLKSGNLRTGKGLSPKSIRQVHLILSKAFSDAARNGFVAQNPVSLVSPPKLEPKEMKHYTADWLSRLLSLSQGTDLMLPIMMASLMGMRKGEILGLSWKQIDLAAGKLRVHSTLSKTSMGLQIQQKTKSARSYRTLPIPPQVTEVLHQLWKDSRNPDPHQLVFTANGKDPIDPDTFYSRFRLFLIRNDLPPIRFHDLRHSYASIAIKAGVDLATLSTLMGHANITTTVHTYGHFDDNQLKKASNQITSMVYPSAKTASE